MKIAVTGKGGAGKTTFSAALALTLSSAGNKVLAFDCDPDSNLAATLGYGDWRNIKPVTAYGEIIRERTAADGSGFFILNPEVSDIAERFAVKIRGVDLLVLGAVKKAEAGCYCAENSFVRNLVRHLLMKKEEYLIMDMEAGIEHLTRGTVKYNDLTFIVVEPLARSLETAERITALASELGLGRVFAVGNRISSARDENTVREWCAAKGVRLAGFVPYDEELKNNKGVIPDKSPLLEAVGKILSVALSSDMSFPAVRTGNPPFPL